MRAKFQYWRSRKHLQNVASLPCQHCGLDGQTQAAHSNMATHGKGRSIKASDQFCAALCFACHHDLDAGHGLTKDEKQLMFRNALRKTWAELLARNLVLIDSPDPLVDN